MTMGRGLSIAGRKKFSATDLYETPEEATLKLLTVEDFKGLIWEPCCGMGKMSQVLEKEYQVYSSDIMEESYGKSGVDMLTVAQRPSNIVTNPPYKDAQEIIEHSLSIVKRKACFLLKLTFLEGQKRKSFFNTSPPSRVWVFSNRITMWPYGEEKPKNGGTIAYAWFVWDKTSSDVGKLGWL